MHHSQVPGLFVVAGLVGAGESDSPTPTPEVAQLQLRALNHRCIDSASGTAGALLEALIHSDFLATRSDGAWLSRADFMAQMSSRAAAPGATVHDEPVRLFGPLALVHGVYMPALRAGSATPMSTFGAGPAGAS